MKIKLIFLIVLGLLNIQSVLVAQDDKVRFQRVDRERLKRAMEMVLEKNTNPKGKHYEPTATTNGVRYHTDVIIELIEEAMQGHEQSEDACLLYINYNDWYEAFKSVNYQIEEIPKYVQEAYDAQQNIVIDYNLKKKISGDIPDIAANVALYWEGGKKSYRYKSKKSIPPLKVINKREIMYRLLKYKDDNLVVCDQIEGLMGRASGFLWFLGKASMTHCRIVPAEDGAQYVWMETKKKVFRWYFTDESELRVETDGVTTEADWENINGKSNEKIKQTLAKVKKTLLREIDIQYKPETLKMDRFRIPADKLAELDCNNGDS